MFFFIVLALGDVYTDKQTADFAPPLGRESIL